MADLHNTPLLATGGAEGTGAKDADQMSALGTFVAIANVTDAAGNAPAFRLRDIGRDVRFVHLGVKQQTQWEVASALCASRWGGLEGVVNNAEVAGTPGEAETDAERCARLSPMKRMAEPLKISKGIALLLSNDAMCIT